MLTSCIAGLHPALAQMTCVKPHPVVLSAASLCPNLQFLLVFTGAAPMVLTISLSGVPVTDCSGFHAAVFSGGQLMHATAAAVAVIHEGLCKVWRRDGNLDNHIHV